MREILLVRFGEVFLKGQNRPFFMKKLMDHIRQAVRPVNGRVWMSEGRFYVSDFTDMDECIRRVTRVFGVHSVSPAIEMDKDNFEAICEQAARMMEPLSGTFKCWRAARISAIRWILRRLCARRAVISSTTCRS